MITKRRITKQHNYTYFYDVEESFFGIWWKRVVRGVFLEQAEAYCEGRATRNGDLIVREYPVKCLK